MLRLRLKIFVGLAAAALSACSDNSPINKQSFQTKGMIPPSATCSEDPSQLGQSQRVRDIDLGNGCFVHNAYKVTSLQNVAFSQAATVNCNVASQTARWLGNIVQPAAEDAFGEAVVEIDVPAAFSCRPRNNVRGAKLSEHGMGNAIDISAFTLASGRKITVEQGWFGDRDAKNFLQRVRNESCGPFKTVLGPGADAHHEDHLHLDLQQHRSGGAYCR